MSTLERAIALAAVAHKGQLDKAGNPYILHPLRVMLSRHVVDADARIAAVLHDVVEDTPVTMQQLRELGFSDAVLAAVEAVTERPEEKGDYFAFVRRAAAHPLGRQVKRADVVDNSDLSRIAQPTEKDHARIARYAAALQLMDDLDTARA